MEEKIRQMQYRDVETFLNDIRSIEEDLSAWCGYLQWDRRYQALLEASHTVTLVVEQLLRKDRTNLLQLENDLLLPPENVDVELKSTHPKWLRSHITFSRMAPSPISFSSTSNEYAAREDVYLPESYPRSAQRADPNDARHLLLVQGNKKQSDNGVGHDVEAVDEYNLMPIPGAFYEWQHPQWDATAWGQFVLNTRLSGSHGGGAGVDSRDGDNDRHPLDHPPRMSLERKRRRLRGDEETRLASVLSTLQIPRDSLGVGDGRIQLAPPSSSSSSSSSSSKTVADDRTFTGQRADDVLPPSSDAVRVLMRSQARHLRLAMQSSRELERQWRRVQIEVMGALGSGGCGHVVNLGDGDVLSELSASNRSLRAQVHRMKNEILEMKRGSASSSSFGSESTSTKHHASLERMRASLQRMDNAAAPGGSILLTSEVRKDMLEDLNALLKK